MAGPILGFVMPDTQTLVILIAAMVAGVVCFRLFMVLGRRTGQEPQARPAASPLSPPAPQPAVEPGVSSGGLLDIQLADRAFDTPKFLAGSREAYIQIVTAFASGDRAILRPLLSPEVYSAFEAGISARSQPPAALVKLQDARIVNSVLHGRTAEITVAFTADFATGSVTDVWSFERNLDSADPNWTLVATSSDLPE
jgi:predicted lipid-binding transport protein (Tim44 family)